MKDPSSPNTPRNCLKCQQCRHDRKKCEDLEPQDLTLAFVKCERCQRLHYPCGPRTKISRRIKTATGVDDDGPDADTTLQTIPDADQFLG